MDNGIDKKGRREREERMVKRGDSGKKGVQGGMAESG